MAMNNAKHVGLIVAEAMPPPNKLKRAMDSGAGDEGETDSDAQDEADSGESGGGIQALTDTFDALKRGDKAGAWDAFCDAVKICAAKAKDDGGSSSDNSGDSGKSDSYS